jgi:carbonic anhydrase
MSHQPHHADCGCTARLSRRGALKFGVAGAALAAFPALAAGGKYEAMLVNCIDPRLTTLSWAYMAGQGYKDLYSHFVITGGPIGIVSPKFAAWQKTFWDNLEISLTLHHIQHIVGLTHRDCGGAAAAFGEAIMKDKALETTHHVAALRAFRAAVGKNQPRLIVHTGIMALDGTVEAVT